MEWGKKVLIALGIFLAILLLVGVLLFGYFNLPGGKAREDVELGMTFSYTYAEALGLNWQETYLALLDEVGIKKMRIPVYWDRVEEEKGKYNYSHIDWQLAEAKKKNVEVILVVGQRVPRWPECHIPTWAKADEEARKEDLLSFVARTVERYKSHSEINMWQVENEPFLTFFGECPKLDVALLDQEVALVKMLDATRPILLTDSGELSLWYKAAHRGDVFGTTLYRHIWNERVGYYTYPIGPNFFRFKEWMTRVLTHQEHFMVIELQAEPWASSWIANVSLPEQFHTMDEYKLRENVDYAKKVGFSQVYLWGGEWWYWLKVKKDYPAVWETARELFKEHGEE